MTQTSPAYRVVAPMIQVGVDHRAHQNTALERQFRAGDVLPTWVPSDELARLAEGGFIEVTQ